MRLRFLLLNIASLAVIAAVPGSLRSFAVEQPSDIPAWLKAHVGDDDGQIAQVVLDGRARFTCKKVSAGRGQQCLLLRHGRNAPRDLGGVLGRRFYVICEANRRSARFRRGMAAAAM